jgi:hypothetical protein
MQGIVVHLAAGEGPGTHRSDCEQKVVTLAVVPLPTQSVFTVAALTSGPSRSERTEK